MAEPNSAPQSANRLEILSRLPASPRRAPPLLFVHGGWHGAWCWDDHFLDFFAARGFAAYALNLRGHGASGGAKDVRYCRISEFVDDVAEAVATIGMKPILVGHSLGGFIVQKYLERAPAELGVLLASVPPDGAMRMLKRQLRSQFLDLLRANLAFSLKPLFSTTQKVRAAMFTPETPEEIVEACRARLQDDTIKGFADYLYRDLVNPAKIATKILVFGAAGDRMIGRDDLEATGRAFGQAPIIIPRNGHDLMLDSNWREAAEMIGAELDKYLGVGPQSVEESARVA